MKSSIFALTLSACLSLAHAQDPIEPDKLQKIAGRLAERASDQENLPLAMEVEAGKATGMTIKDYGTIILPAKGLSTEVLAKAGAEIVPIGFLWLHSLVPSVEGKALATEKRRAVKVVFDQEERTVQLLTLGFRKNAEGGLELVVLTKDKDAVLTLPLKEEQRDQQWPVALEMRQGTSSLGEIDIHVLGRLHAVMPVEQP